MTDVSGKRILLGITGGIAAYKAAELTRLSSAGADVRVVMNRGRAVSFHRAGDRLQALSGQPCTRILWTRACPTAWATSSSRATGTVVVVAPATTDFLAKSRTDSATTCSRRFALRAAAPSWSRRR